MKRLFLSTLCVALLLNQSTRPEPSWAEKILNPKVALLGLGIACIATNLAWGITWWGQTEEITDLEKKLEKAKKISKDLENRCKEIQDQSKKLEIYKPQKKKYPLTGIRDSVDMIIEYKKYRQLEAALRTEKRLDPVFNPIENKWEFLDRGALEEESLADVPGGVGSNLGQIDVDFKSKKTLALLKKFGTSIVVRDTSIQSETNEIKELMYRLGFVRESFAKNRTSNTWVNTDKPIQIQ